MLPLTHFYRLLQTLMSYWMYEKPNNSKKGLKWLYNNSIVSFRCARKTKAQRSSCVDFDWYQIRYKINCLCHCRYLPQLWLLGLRLVPFSYHHHSGLRCTDCLQQSLLQKSPHQPQSSFSSLAEIVREHNSQTIKAANNHSNNNNIRNKK